MVGLVLNNPQDLYNTRLVDINPNAIIEGYIYNSNEYVYPFKYIVVGFNELSIASYIQMLIDEGCTMIIYLGMMINTEDRIINVVDSQSDIDPIARFTKYVKYSGESIISDKLLLSDKSMRSNHQLNCLGSIINTVSLNNTQLLMLIYRSKVNDSDKVYSKLGEVLSSKLELILKTDYEYYDKESDESEVFSPNKLEAFTPATKPPLFELPPRFKNKVKKGVINEN